MSYHMVMGLEIVLKEKIPGKIVLNIVANMMTVLTGATRQVIRTVIGKVENI